MSNIDQRLLADTITLGDRFDQTANRLERNGDHRVFFTWSHGYITKKIAKHINLFIKPNELMKLNKLFANDFLRAVNGAPHGNWQKAFDVCSGLTDARSAGFTENIMFSTGSFEMCAACMAKVHINQDLKNALRKVSDVDPQDYGNTLTLVNLGHLHAEKRLRGTSSAALVLMVQLPLIKNLKMTAEIWRNQAFEEAIGKKVPPASEEFNIAYQKADGW